MRYLRLFCATAALTLAFAFTVYAGGIECDFAPSTQPTATAGEIECPGLTDVLVTVIEGTFLLV